MNVNTKIYIAGHCGLVGSSLLRKLQAQGYKNIVTRTHAELDLTNRIATEAFFVAEKPDFVFLAAAKVGGILANNIYPADFISINLAIQNNVIQAAYRHDVQRLLFLGSSCIYPRDCSQPIKEEYLLSGPLEATNRSYAIAKIAGIEQCWSYNRQYGTQFLAIMPTNIYGRGDHYDLVNTHVIPALIRKCHEAKICGNDEVVIWGTGTVKREFLFSDDLANASVFLMCLSDESFGLILNSQSVVPPIINIGCGEDLVNTHVIPALIRKCHEAKICGNDEVVIWGTGTVKREFLFSDDLADASVFLMCLSDESFGLILNSQSVAPPIINIGCGEDLTIQQLAEIVKKVVGFHGKIIYDSSKPDGTPRKLLNCDKINRLGWTPKVSLREGVEKSYKDFLQQLIPASEDINTAKQTRK